MCYIVLGGGQRGANTVVLAVVGIQSSKQRESGVLAVGVLMRCLQNQEKQNTFSGSCGRCNNRPLKGMSFRVVQ